MAFATRDPFLLKLLTQVNVWVGPFFVLSGYVAGYTATELAKFEASPRVKPAGAYTVARVAGYYPLFMYVQILFGAMFAFADWTYNGPVATVAHAIMSATLTQVRQLGCMEVVPGVACCACGAVGAAGCSSCVCRRQQQRGGVHGGPKLRPAAPPPSLLPPHLCYPQQPLRPGSLRTPKSGMRPPGSCRPSPLPWWCCPTCCPPSRRCARRG